MFDRKIGAGLPGKVIRIGKAWHGLVVFAASRAIADAVIKTSGGKTLPYPYPKSREEDATQEYNAFGTPHLSVYMHPLAVFEAELENGMDWSQYAIMQLFRSRGIALAGYSSRAIEFFFTPDYNENAIDFEPIQRNAIPLSFDTNQGKLEIVVSTPIKYDKPTDFFGRKSFPNIDKVSELFHASRDGRSYFFYELYAGASLAYDPLARQPLVSRVDMSGHLGGGLSTIDAVQTMITGAPADSAQDYFTDDVEYTALDGTDPITYETVNYLPTGTGRRWYLTYKDYEDKKTASGVASVFIDDAEQISYLVFNREVKVKDLSSGTLSVSGNLIFNSTLSSDKQYLNKFELSHGANLSTLEAASNISESSWTRWQAGLLPTDPPRIDESDGTVVGTVTLSIDGTDVFSSAGSSLLEIGNVYQSRFRNLKTVIFSATVARAVYSVRRISESEFEFIEIYIYKTDWGSKDLTSLAALVRKGRTNDAYDQYWIDPATVEQSLHFGKVFSKDGSVLNENVSYDEIDFPDAIYRAYNPLTKEISEVYNTPIIYQ